MRGWREDILEINEKQRENGEISDSPLNRNCSESYDERKDAWMGLRDVVSNDYMGNSARVADLLNGYLYHGMDQRA